MKNTIFRKLSLLLKILVAYAIIYAVSNKFEIVNLDAVIPRQFSVTVFILSAIFLLVRFFDVLIEFRKLVKMSDVINLAKYSHDFENLKKKIQSLSTVAKGVEQVQRKTKNDIQKIRNNESTYHSLMLDILHDINDNYQRFVEKWSTIAIRKQNKETLNISDQAQRKDSLIIYLQNELNNLEEE